MVYSHQSNEREIENDIIDDGFFDFMIPLALSVDEN